MNITDTRKAAEVMLAFCEGAEVMRRNKDMGGLPAWNWHDQPDTYAVIPEPELVPYTLDDMPAVLLEKGPMVIDKKYKDIYTIADCHKDTITFNHIVRSYARTLEWFTWLDGTPCGKEK